MSRRGGALRAIARLAQRDARRHRGRTLIALLLIAGPIAAAVLAISTTSLAATSREDALAALPEGASATITATAVVDAGQPLPQTPEGSTGPYQSDPDTVPAMDAQLREVLGDDADLREWWRSPTLIATTDLDLAPGEQSSVSATTAVDGLDAWSMSAIVLQEADPQTLEMLLPRLAEGTAPRSSDEIVLTTSAAQRLDVGIGDTVQLIAPPSTGWMGADGLISTIVEDSLRGYRVVGIAAPDEARNAFGADSGATPFAPETDEHAWAGAEWLPQFTDSAPGGVTRHLILAGEEPVTWDQVRALNEQQVLVTSRYVLENPPPNSELYPVAVDPETAALQAGMAAAAGIGCAVLLILLVTPAFLVGAERQRRILGLAIAAGADPGMMRTMLLIQGAGLGLLGSTLGVLGGIVLVRMLPAVLPGEAGAFFAARLGSSPLWTLVLLVVLGTALGTFATLPAALRASLVDPVEAMTRHRPPTSSSGAVRTWLLALPLLFIGGAGAAGAVLGGGQLGALLVAVSTLAALAAALVLVPALVELVALLAARAPLALRLPAREIHRDRSRTTPAICAVLIASALLSIFSVVMGSLRADQLDTRTAVVAEGHAVLGIRTPLNDALDAAILESVADHLEEKGLILDSHPVFSHTFETRVMPVPMPAPGAECPGTMGVSPASAVHPGREVECVDELSAWNPGLRFPSPISDQILVMEPEALRASGHPGAEQAAQVLSEGGVVVNDVTRLDTRSTGVPDRGTVTIQMQRWDTDGPGVEVVETVDRPGIFLHGAEGSLVMSPGTARELSIPLRYIGEVLVVPDPLDAEKAAHLEDAAAEVTTLSWPDAAPRGELLWMGRMQMAALLALVLLAVLGSGASVVLGRGEAQEDLTILRAVGAAPRRLALHGVTQAGLVLLLGMVPGVLAGGGIGVLLVLRNRAAQLGGGWLEIAPLWPALCLGITAMAASVLAAALITGRPPRELRG
ncbi:FtsX-like permease family protein [Brachybacterium phenoliresistens]|nr:FtsX-like permease family protein [Brachybacterium phenoliresistens]